MAGLMLMGCAAPVGHGAEDLHRDGTAPDVDWAVRPNAQDGVPTSAPEQESGPRDVRYETEVGVEQGAHDQAAPEAAPYEAGCAPGDYELMWPADTADDARDPVALERGGELVFEAEGELHDVTDEDWYVLPEEAAHYFGREVEAELLNVPQAKFALQIQKFCDGKMTAPARGDELARYVDSCAVEGPLYVRVGADNLGAFKCLRYRLVVRSGR